MNRRLLTLLLLAGLGAAFFLNIRLGHVSLTTLQTLQILTGEGDPIFRRILLEIRLPRALLGLLVGGGLALSGSVFQALLRNPLAEPYILGISGGSAAGAVAVLSLGLASRSSVLLPAAAFGGALLAIFLVFGVAASADRRLDVRVLLLAGVVVGAFFTAVIALILSISEAQAVRSAVLWMMGSLAGASWKSVAVVAAYTLPATLILMGLARALNLMAVGEETASYLGTDVERVKRIAYAVASLITAAGVAVAGIIGFVGLIIPHILRLLVGSDQRVILPLSFLAGAAFLMLADVGARLILDPTEIPIGVITAFLGVPLFLVLLRRSLSG
ncbi:MAG: iron ABC transporter permease [Longimicrobiales bacterium]